MHHRLGRGGSTGGCGGGSAERGQDDGNILSFAYVWGLRVQLLQQSGCALKRRLWQVALFTLPARGLYRVGFCIVYIMTCICTALWVTSVASDDDDDDD